MLYKDGMLVVIIQRVKTVKSGYFRDRICWCRYWYLMRNLYIVMSCPTYYFVAYVTNVYAKSIVTERIALWTTFMGLCTMLLGALYLL